VSHVISGRINGITNRNIKLPENVLRENGGSAVNPGRTLGRNEKNEKRTMLF
jgi:hypothetical protein